MLIAQLYLGYFHVLFTVSYFCTRNLFWLHRLSYVQYIIEEDGKPKNVKPENMMCFCCLKTILIIFPGGCAERYRYRERYICTQNVNRRVFFRKCKKSLYTGRLKDQRHLITHHQISTHTHTQHTACSSIVRCCFVCMSTYSAPWWAIFLFLFW